LPFEQVPDPIPETSPLWVLQPQVVVASIRGDTLGVLPEIANIRWTLVTGQSLERADKSGQNVMIKIFGIGMGVAYPALCQVEMEAIANHLANEWCRLLDDQLCEQITLLV
jgi:hypothetical protein